LLIGIAAGVTAAWFFDPRSGRRRRHMAFDRSRATGRRVVRRTGRFLRGGQNASRARVAKLTHLRERPKHLTDEALRQKVMSEVFRDPRIPKGHLNLNVEDGCVVLRGYVEDVALVDELERRVRHVVGVRSVENLVHIPG
jgi:osmotically-inducible protein OsmY